MTSNEPAGDTLNFKKIRRWINSQLMRRGYEIVRVKPRTADGYTLFSYRDSAGNVEHDRYRRVQAEGNQAKHHYVWAQEENVKFIARYVAGKLGAVQFGLCHGTRTGHEQKWFKETLGCQVLGTEISDSATQYPDTIQWDFHDVKDEWLDRCDFIYSNSFDHTYDPEHCLNQWMRCLRPGGLCILEHSYYHSPGGASALDPFGADLQQMPYLVLLWGKGRFAITEIVEAPKLPSPDARYLVFLVLTRFAETM